MTPSRHRDLPASRQDGSYPRPQLVRAGWADLCGPWDFAFGAAQDPDTVPTFNRTIEVPFPPESPASGIGDRAYHPVVWYRRTVGPRELDDAGERGPGRRVLLHLGAVDQVADVWVNGHHVGHHEGGQAPFTCDVTAALGPGETHELLVRAQDDPNDVSMPRGKQDWRERPHSIWYHRTTGIWQPVWLETVPAAHVEELALTPDVPAGAVDLELRLSAAAEPDLTVRVRVEHDGELLAEGSARALRRDLRLRLDLARQHDGQQDAELLWSPEHPTLLDVTVEVLRRGRAVDVVRSYTGLRSVGATARRFMLNDRPYFVRSVLEQGYWPQSHLAAPSAAALRREVELIKALGFNAARVHQKAEDPRFLFWADRLGLLVWGETANAYAFDARAVTHLTTEWAALVRRDRSHPCVVTWVPLNESWGVPHAAHDPAQRHYGLALAHLTRALDPTRPVVSNDGWEHTDSDIWTVHDYTPDGATLRARYGTPGAIGELLDGLGPAGRRMRLTTEPDRGQPVMLTEFGGVSLAPASDPDAWGYSTARDAADLRARLTEIFDAVNACAPLAGYCYTQLADTGQETNGLLTADREPKLPLGELRAIIAGDDDAPAGPADEDAHPGR
ncbi:glycoside hydrolase family 2 protein [Georgenia thermotolerans]|uniref:glycoside hydrolase family 2 protein n=1 Tax=Georgenia thermotolerans TaxID=527326 RepID=UPI001D01EAC9|nr:glycoside hydrolase family 2 TIM barrel-domain containing protein [Georgenia thermotolerans]